MARVLERLELSQTRAKWAPLHEPERCSRETLGQSGEMTVARPLRIGVKTRAQVRDGHGYGSSFYGNAKAGGAGVSGGARVEEFDFFK